MLLKWETGEKHMRLGATPKCRFITNGLLKRNSGKRMTYVPHLTHTRTERKRVREYIKALDV